MGQSRIEIDIGETNVQMCCCILGYACEAHNNPADFFLDVINGDSTATAMNKIQGEGHFHTRTLTNCAVYESKSRKHLKGALEPWQHSKRTRDPEL